MNTTITTEPLSIDAVLSKLQHWRDNKSSYPDSGIPNTVWEMIFSLEAAGHRAATLRSLFGLNSAQYTKKREQLKAPPTKKSNPIASTKTPSKASEPINSETFAEVSVTSSAPPQAEVPSLAEAAANNQQAVKHLRSTNTSPEQYLDTTTIIVECIRSDGYRLKIHTTNNRVDAIMQAFFNQRAISC